MRLCTIRSEHAGEHAAVVTSQGIVPVAAINAHLGRPWPTALYDIIVQGMRGSAIAGLWGVLQQFKGEELRRESGTEVSELGYRTSAERKILEGGCMR